MREKKKKGKKKSGKPIAKVRLFTLFFSPANMKAISEQREKIALICCLKVKAKIIDEAGHVSDDFFFLFFLNFFRP